MKELFAYLLSSLDNINKGASGKKLTALAISLAYCYSHRYVDASNLAIVLGVDGGTIAILFGINVADKLKNPSEQNENNENQPKGN